MGTYAEKKANKAKKALDAIYPLEWEELALQEVIDGFKTAWGDDRKHYDELSRENENIIFPSPPKFDSDNQKLIDLYSKIFKHLIYYEPYLYRLLAYIQLPPSDKKSGRSFFCRYLGIDIFNDILNIITQANVFVKNEHAIQRGFKTTPLHSTFVGKVLTYLYKEAEQRRIADFEVQPCFNVIREKNKIIFEFFEKADYDIAMDTEIDDLLYVTINNAQRDIRQKAFFGEDIDNAKYEIIKRCKGQKDIIIPFQLLPKYARLIRKRAKGLPKVETTATEQKTGKVIIKQELNLTIVEMAFLEAALGVPYKKQDEDEESNSDKQSSLIKAGDMPFAAFIKNQITYRLGNEWANQSTEALKKVRLEQVRWQHSQSDEKDLKNLYEKEERISKAKLEQSGGSLDDFIDEDQTGRRIDFLEDEDGLDPETDITEKERLRLQNAILAETRKDGRFMAILESGQRRTPADQKYYERKIAEMKKLFGLKDG